MRLPLSILFLLIGLNSPAQGLDSLESKMAGLVPKMSNAKSAEDRLDVSNQFEQLLHQCFETKGVFEYPFYKLPTVVSSSPDNKFRLFNWNVPMENGTHNYRAFILFPNGDDYVELKDNSKLEHDMQQDVLNPDDWYGAIYYEIFPITYKRETYYTLLGWDGNDDLSTKKVMDVLNIDRKNNVSFGRAIYETDKGFLHRRVFEFAEGAAMSIRFFKNKNALIFNRLEPENPTLEGQYSYYGPGTGYSGYHLNEQGLWQLEEFIDMSRPEPEEGARFNFPDRVDYKRSRSKTNPLTGE